MSVVEAVEEDLDALFDQVSSEHWPAPVESAAEAASEERPATDAGPAAPASDVPAGMEACGEQLFKRLGHLTRVLHDSLRELGYDAALERAAQALPEARDRLAYIAELTGKAADRALDAVERGKTHGSQLTLSAGALSAEWDRVYDGAVDVDQFKAIAGRTREFLRQVPSEAAAIDGHFTEILMAQEFHDLTGQLIGKTVAMAREMESELLGLLLEMKSGLEAAEAQHHGLEGPVFNAAGRTDVVTSQAQVDELLDSLGF